jgi:saccharopine dehydrogenase (NAD+, L-lysine forming)
MRVLVVGAGGVGAAVAAIARRRSFIEHLTLADVNSQRAARVAVRLGDEGRFAPAQVDASDEAQLAELIASTGPDAVLNAINPLIALRLIDAGTWNGAGVLGPEAFDAAPFLDLLADYGAPHGVDERAP